MSDKARRDGANPQEERSAQTLTPEALAFFRHELRTPINAIMGYGEMLLEDAEDAAEEDLAAELREVVSAGRSILRRINESLDSSRLAAGLLDMSGVRSVSRQLAAPARSIRNRAAGLIDVRSRSADDHFRSDLKKIQGAARQLETLLEAADPHRVPAASAPTRAESQPAWVPKRPAADSGKVLVVDDNASNRDLLGRHLVREGHTVYFAENGRQALEMMAEGQFDLVLLDILMPEMDGREVLRRLRSDDRLHRTRVVVCSALDDISSVAECVKLGAEDYLHKPFDPVLLRARIRASLEKKRFRDREQRYLHEIEAGKEKADRLLHLLYPAKIVEELKASSRVKPRSHEDVAVFFADLVGFTSFCQTRRPEAVLRHLQQVDDAFEELTLRHGLEKIKTIGDAFMAAAGLLRAVENPVLDCVRCGLDFVERLGGLPAGWKVRVGIHVGPLIAGVVGRRKSLFDVWGATVNTAARVESNGDIGAVNLSRAAWSRISDQCRGHSLGCRNLKGIGEVEIYRVDSLA